MTAPSLWGFSLLCELRHLRQTTPSGWFAEPALEEVEQALRAALVAAVPVSRVPDDTTACAFDTTIIPAVETWLAQAGENESTRMLATFLEPAQRIARPEELSAALRRLPESAFGDQLFVTHVLCGLATLGRAPEKELWERLQNPEWRDRVLLEMGEEPLDGLFRACRDIQLLRSGRWAWNLPHIYAAACEKATVEGRRGLLFSMVMLASLDSGSTSAIERLLKGTHGKCLVVDVSHWRDRFAEFWHVAPAIVTARWRPVMTALSLCGGLDLEGQAEGNEVAR